MKIVVITKSLNEEHNIANFCTGYDWANLILVADGGSTDRTKEIAQTFSNVKVKDFEQRVELPDGSFMNPEPAHVNFLIDWANEEEADWIILDGCDCWPNSLLRAKARDFFRWATVEDYDGIMLYRLYMWDHDHYLPKINEAGPSMWAWRPDRVDCHTPEDEPTFFDAVMPGPDPERCLILDPPYVCLHYFEPEKKAKRYVVWGHPQSPIENGIYWPPEPLPDWAR